MRAMFISHSPPWQTGCDVFPHNPHLASCLVSDSANDQCREQEYRQRHWWSVLLADCDLYNLVILSLDCTRRRWCIEPE
jgi:hypothetical protein